MGEISQLHLDWFKSRGISEETVRRGGIYSVSRSPNGGFEPSDTGNILVFPFVKDGKVVNTKYRGPNKQFFSSVGGKKVFFGVDCLADPTLQDGTNALVICEGEMDWLAFQEAGYPYVVSVPNGAPPAREGRNAYLEINPEQDIAFSYVFQEWNHIKAIKTIIIAVDNDEPGKRLQEELVRRLGQARCRFVTYPDDCKDANDVLSKHGVSAVLALLKAAKEYPVSGLYTLDDLPPEPDLCVVNTGFPGLDEGFRPFLPSFTVVTGPYSSGKSTWTMQLATNLAHLHGWKCALASYEMRIKPFVIDSLQQGFIEAGGEARRAEDFVRDNFFFIAPRRSNSAEETFNIDWLIEKAEIAVVRYGIKVLLIDPWNEIEHSSHGKFEAHTDYVGRAIQQLKNFGMEYKCMVIVVAHPPKGTAQNKSPENYTLYDVADSAHFANKADHGITVARLQGSNQAQIIVTKCRYEGRTGKKDHICPLTFDQGRRVYGLV